MAHGEITLAEVKSQPNTWGTALNLFGQQLDQVLQVWASGKFDPVLQRGFDPDNLPFDPRDPGAH